MCYVAEWKKLRWLFFAPIHATYVCIIRKDFPGNGVKNFVQTTLSSVSYNLEIQEVHSISVMFGLQFFY